MDRVQNTPLKIEQDHDDYDFIKHELSMALTVKDVDKHGKFDMDANMSFDVLWAFTVEESLHTENTTKKSPCTKRSMITWINCRKLERFLKIAPFYKYA